LIDEADTFLKDNDEMRGILNSGHRKGGGVVRNVGDDHEPRQFSTWAPAAIAMIGRLPGTLEDRSVHATLRRRLRTESVELFRSDRTGKLETLARKAARWAADHETQLRKADPFTGDLQNRTADNWRPLLAIAEAVGGEWRDRAMEIATRAALSKDDGSVGVRLLADVKAAFDDAEVDAMSSAVLIGRLTADPESEWTDYRGKPLTQKGLGRLLGKYGIRSETLHLPDLPDARGYRRERFGEVWEAYL
jgi:hypothetical protein